MQVKQTKGDMSAIGWLLVVIVLIAGTGMANAQVEKNTDYSPDKTLKSTARVNPSTLAMELSIPISGYAGRAGSGMPVALNYSSKVWEMKHSGIWESQLLGTQTGVAPTFAKRTAGGWTSSLGTPRLDYRFDRYRDQDATGNAYSGQVYSPAPWEEDPQQPFYLYYIPRITVVMPDGSSHELRASDSAVSCGDTSTGCTSVNLFGTFLSVDGSRLRLESGVSSSSLYMPDGSRYVFGAFTGSTTYTDTGDPNLAYAFYDRHGNKMTYDAQNRQWVDTMGRVLDDPFPQNWYSQTQQAGTQTVDFPGFGTGMLEYEFTWSYLKDPVGTDHALDNTNLDPYNLSDIYCQGNIEHTVTGAYLFGNVDAYTRICGTGYSSQGPPFNPIVLTKIELPNGASYRFKYNVYGEVVRIIYPTGAYERFDYQQLPPLQAGSDAHDRANRGVSDRWVSESGSGNDEIHWGYEITRGTVLDPAPYVAKTTNPDGTYSEQYLYDEPDPEVHRPFGFSDAKTGRSYEDRVYSAGDVLLRRNLTGFEETQATGGINGNMTATRDMRPTKQISIIFEPGESSALATMTETVYDTSGNSDPASFSSLNPKQTKTYNYVVVSASTAATADIETASGWFSSSNLAKIIEMDYLYDSNYKARNITGLVTETRVKDANGNVKAKTQISYDDANHSETSSGTMPTAAANSWVDPLTELGSTIGSKRGLPTTVKSYYDIANGYYIQTENFYDQFGNLRKARDGRGNDTWTEYDDDYAFAYPTSVTTPVPDSNGTYGSNAASTTTSTYDYNTGLPLSVTDPNGLTTKTDYDDPLLRPTRTRFYSGSTQVGSTTETIYGTPDSNGQLPASERYIKVRSQINADSWKEAYTWFDGLGRTARTQSVDNAADDIFVATCYDSMGRVSKTSNPVRSSSAPTCSSSLEWTTPTYDDLGRTISLTTPDSAHVNTAYSLATTGNRVGTVVTVTDQAGKLRRSITNALGQLTRVDEPDTSSSTGSLGAINSPNQPTVYSYDLLNNLTSVQQDGDTTDECGGASSCSQSRSFVYDALSRLKTATNPESGTINYTYDNNGNLAIKTDARGIVTTYTYDRLNRVTNRAYTNVPSGSETPDVTYFYDNLTNAKGKLIKVSSSVSTTEYTGFDILGRVTSHKQTTNGGATAGYTTAYTYKLDGALDEETYPSTRVVKNTLDSNGDLAIVKSKKDSTHLYWNYAQNFVYNASGAVSSMELGNGRWESTSFNSRLQPEQIALGTLHNATDLLKLNYGYGTTANNGNVLSQTITVTGTGGFTAVQNYTYDSLNRLQMAVERPNGWTDTNCASDTTKCWKQEFAYDRYGNRNFVTGTGHTDTLAGCTTMCNPSFNTSNNRINSSGYSFDNAGDTTSDPSGQVFTYDAENKQVLVTNGSGTVGQYWYDGDGKRVKKYVPGTGETTIFVYDAAGKEIAEYSSIVANSANAKVNYLTADHLGSPRINTDQNGAVIARQDYMPFGEEISNIGGRNNNSDTVRKQFTGYERDTETELDFAQARYFIFNQGRFSSVDPYSIVLEIQGGSDSRTALSRYLQSPQIWNRYTYTKNNPLKLIDPSGEDGLVVVFTDYRIEVSSGPKLPFIGHAGIVLIDEDGTTHYYEYGRYDKEQKGLTRKDEKGPLPKLQFTSDGVATEDSVKALMSALSEKYGQGGSIEGAYFNTNQDTTNQMREYAEKRLSENDDPDRRQYSLTDNQCMTFTRDVLAGGGVNLSADMTAAPVVPGVASAKAAGPEPVRRGMSPLEDIGVVQRGTYSIPKENRENIRPGRIPYTPSK